MKLFALLSLLLLAGCPVSPAQQVPPQEPGGPGYQGTPPGQTPPGAGAPRTPAATGDAGPSGSPCDGGPCGEAPR